MKLATGSDSTIPSKEAAAAAEIKWLTLLLKHRQLLAALLDVTLAPEVVWTPSTTIWTIATTAA